MRSGAFLIPAVLIGSGYMYSAGDTDPEPIERNRVEISRLSRQGSEDAEGPHPPPGTVVIVNTVLADNGDGDAWADTNETAELQITVYNRMGFDLTGVEARLFSEDPKVACIANSTVEIGDLADREIRRISDTFSFLVADVTRTSLSEEFSITFTVSMSADQFESLPNLQEITLDLDFDVQGGSDATTYFESFEDGFGTFTPMHLDETLNPPDNDPSNHPLGLQNADGYRCQYSDPDWENSITFGLYNAYYDCYPGVNGGPDAFWFHVTTDRAFHGVASMHWGVFLDEARGFTTPPSQLEAIRMIEPVNLGWGRVCKFDRTIPCETATDCPSSDECVRSAPVLSFKHQISMVDHRTINASPFQSSERAVVDGQLIDAAGDPISDWIKLQPYVNVYDTVANSNYFNCTFDPIDDGNTEENFFDPEDPGRYLGPSSTCAPERNFVDQGDTGSTFSEFNIGDASDGPGLEGNTGLGTWVEPQFDLERFRGRRVRLRFLATGQKVGRAEETWEGFLLGINPDPADDGWFIDNVVVTDTLVQPATVSVDVKDNLTPKSDFDFDGVGATCDCAPDDGTAWLLPGPISDLVLFHSGGATGSTALSWGGPEVLGGTAVEYDTVRSPSPIDFLSLATCLESHDGIDTAATDTTTPDAGVVHYFLVRATNSCGGGPLGTNSETEARTAVDCL